MKISVAWNVWNNYEDVLLGSEIFRLESERLGGFEKVSLMSQGGYETPPNEEEMRYLDCYQVVEIDEHMEMIKHHVKYKGVYRVLNGLKKAYEFGLENDSDFVLMTNGDAWCLDLARLGKVLESNELANAAISARVGTVTALYNTYGGFVPFFDDHFMVINVPLCQELKVFDYDTPKAYEANFLHYGGIHYILCALMDEIVPAGRFHVYTHLEDCVNHFGEPAGYSLLPWQYQPSMGFLHANCAQEPFLHDLRAAQLKLHGLDRYPEVNRYCQRHQPHRAIEVCRDKGYVFYQQGWLEKQKYWMLHGAKNALNLWRRYGSERRFVEYANAHYAETVGQASLHYYDAYSHVYPLGMVQRRPA